MRMSVGKCENKNNTFKSVLIDHEQTVHLHLFSKGRLMGRGAAGEQLTRAHTAGESLRRERGKEKLVSEYCV